MPGTAPGDETRPELPRTAAAGAGAGAPPGAGRSPLRAAVIGLGRMGSTFDEEVGRFGRWQPPHAHAACYRAVRGVELVAGADPHPEQRAAFGRRWGLPGERVYADHREMLSRERPDLVSVCTSAGPRAALVRDVLSAGAGVRGIWAEKPMAISLAEADAMVDGCRRAGVTLAVGASRCWDATYNRMRELIDLGEIGEVLQVSGYGRCHLSHNGSHLLTLVAYLAAGGTRDRFARARWVSGHADPDPDGDGDFSANAYVQFEHGAQGFVRALASGAADWEFEVIGSRGRLRAVNDGEEVELWKTAAATLPGRRREVARHVFPRPQGHDSANVCAVLDLVRCVAAGGPGAGGAAPTAPLRPVCDGEAGRQALEIAIAARESHRAGGARVALPLADRTLRIISQETLGGDEPAAVRRARAAGATA